MFRSFRSLNGKKSSMLGAPPRGTPRLEVLRLDERVQPGSLLDGLLAAALADTGWSHRGDGLTDGGNARPSFGPFAARAASEDPAKLRGAFEETPRRVAGAIEPESTRNLVRGGLSLDEAEDLARGVAGLLAWGFPQAVERPKSNVDSDSPSRSVQPGESPSTGSLVSRGFESPWTSSPSPSFQPGEKSKRSGSGESAPLIGGGPEMLSVPASPDIQVNTYTTNTQIAPAIASDDDGDFVVVWQSVQDGSNTGIYAQRFDKNGAPVGAEFRVNTYTTDYQSAPDVAMDADGDFVVVWDSYFQDGSLRGIYAQRYGSDGMATGGEFRVNWATSGGQVNPSVAMDANGNFAVAFGSNNKIYTRLFNREGSPRDTEIIVDDDTGDGGILVPDVAMDDAGNFVVAWQEYGLYGYNSEIVARRYSSDGSAVGAEFVVNTFVENDQSYPSVAMDGDGDFVVAWQSYYQYFSDVDFGIFAQRYNATATPLGSEFLVNSYTTGSQIDPSVAMDQSGNFVGPVDDLYPCCE